jgi:hypothetical protein
MALVCGGLREKGGDCMAADFESITEELL